jgi:PAS domain S-box-containing protein
MEQPDTAGGNLIAESAAPRIGANESELAAGERGHDEESLSLSEARHRALLEHAACGIYRSVLEERFQAVNPALVQMLGYESVAELLRVDLAKDVYAQPGDREKLVRQFSNGAHKAAMEVIWRRKDGEPIAVRLDGRRVPQDADCFDVTAVDLSEQRNLEAQLRQAQKMEVVGQLTGGIAHDFNNLLTVIQTNMGIIDCLAPPASSELHECLEAIKVSTRRGAVLIKKLLSFSREQRLERRPLDLAPLIEELSAMARRIVPETIEILIGADQSVDTIEADPGAVQQILFNLITNARDAMPEGGVLTIEIGVASLDTEYQANHPWVVPGRYASVAVSDSGVGMDEETRLRVFEPFFTTKRSDKGTGLGMAMVYGLMKEHRGYIDVSSVPGKGTTVELYFPLSGAATKVADQQLPAEQVQGGTETILVVEDEA